MPKDKKAKKAKKAKAKKVLARNKNYSDMSDDEYRKIIDALGLNQVQAAKFLDVEARTSRRWAGGEPIPGVVASLLRYMLRKDRTPQDIRPEWTK